MTTASLTTAALSSLALAACGAPRDGGNVANATVQTDAIVEPHSEPAAPATPAPSNSNAAEPSSPQPDAARPVAARPAPAQSPAPEKARAQRPLGEAEAALGVAKRFADLLSTKRFSEAYAMWADGGPSPKPSAADFAKRFAAYSSVTARAAPPAQVEGAAGSLYAEVPIVLTGTTESGVAFRRPGSVTVKRVNDVPGASAAQLRWHIVDVKF